MKYKASFTQYAIQKEFTLQAAAHLLCGLPPNRPLDSEEFCSIQTIVFALCESIESGHLFARGFKPPQNGWWEVEGIISNTDLGQWAKVRNFCWPPVGGMSDNSWFVNPYASISPKEKVNTPQGAGSLSNQKDIALAEQVADLTERLQQAKAENSIPDYLNPSHPRYSHKLAAAIAVWNVMEDEDLLRGASTKTAMTNWLTANQKENGFELSKTGINEVVIVANWSTKGGAPKTPQPK